MRIPNYALDIPSDSQELIRRLSDLFPKDADKISKFVFEVKKN